MAETPFPDDLRAAQVRLHQATAELMVFGRALPWSVEPHDAWPGKELIAALETLKSAMDADTALPGTATVWAELWNAAACGLHVAMDNEFHNLSGSEVVELPAGDQFMGAAKAQAAVLSELFSIALENEPQGIWGAQIRTR
ncbi:hypothetical protein [Streptomyces sp. NPDC058330]|uniref:hypothetical protein n=1 Tax=Streptomyces sp. NPDC058330 TaxID=3346449 RepID=UPI0036E4EC9D